MGRDEHSTGAGGDQRVGEEGGFGCPGRGEVSGEGGVGGGVEVEVGEGGVEEVPEEGGGHGEGRVRN